MGIVREHCSTRGAPVLPRLVHVDIGPTKEWGYPDGEARRDDWRSYHERIWADPEASRADFYLVDGRFRVACFAQVLLHAAPDALIAIHDFANRPDYHVVHDVAREVARTENLSVFLRRRDYDPRRALAILEEHALVPA